jgi:Eukaryotic protein of unknown function (DUF842)
MISPAAQAKVEADNARLEGSVRMAIDDIDKTLMRKTAREGLVCSLKCYDAAGQQGSAESLQQCISTCEQPHQRANAIVRQVRWTVVWFFIFYIYVVCVKEYCSTSSIVGSHPFLYPASFCLN